MKRWIALAVLLLGPLSVVSQANAQGFPTQVPYMLPTLALPTPGLPNIVVPTPPPFPTPPLYQLPSVTPAPIYSQIERPADGVVCWYVPPIDLGDGTSAVIRYACEDGSILASISWTNMNMLMVEARNDDGTTTPVGFTSVIPRR